MSLFSRLLKVLPWPFQKITTTVASVVSKERRRHLRIQLRKSGRVYFRITQPNLEHRFQVLNISFSGISLRLPQEVELPSEANELAGCLSIGNQEINTWLKIVRRDHNSLAGMFTSQAQTVESAIRAELDIELKALKLTEMPSRVLKSEPIGTPRYFHSPNFEIFFVENHGSLVRFHLSLFGNYFENHGQSTVQYGEVQEDSYWDNEDSGVSHKPSLLVNAKHSAVSSQVIQDSQRFIQAIEQIPTPIRDEICSQLESVRRKRS
jgi:hypothetical protein